MTALSTEVKFIRSTFAGAPTLNAAAGSLVAILDAVLVNGFNSSNISSIVVSSGIATAAQSSGPQFGYKSVVTIAGCSEAALNGQKRVIATTSNTFSYDATGVADGTYSTGTITAIYAPLGWEISFTDTNKRIYRSLNQQRDAVSLYVDDTNTFTGWNQAQNVSGTYRSQAYVAMVTDVTSISAFTLLTTSNYFWIKSNVSSGGSNWEWSIIGDSLGFFINTTIANWNTSESNYFGKLKNPIKANDNFITLLTAYYQASADRAGSSSGSAPGDESGTSAQSNTTSNFGAFSPYSNVNKRVLARSFSQIGVAVAASIMPSSYSTNSGLTASIAYPAPIDGGVYYATDLVVLESGQGPRGYLPGYCQLLQYRPFGPTYLLENVASDPNKTFFTWEGHASTTAQAPSVSYRGEWMFDIIGPWR